MPDTNPFPDDSSLIAFRSGRELLRACFASLIVSSLAGGLPAQNRYRESTRRVLPPSTAAECLALGDIDSDGDLDLVLGQANGGLRLWLSLYANTWRDETVRLPLLGFTPIRALEFRDVDRDSDQDLIVATAGLERVLINQAGRFTDQSATRLSGVNDDTAALVVFDADRDGDDDIFTANVGQNRLFVNDGSGVFADATASRLPVDNEVSGSAASIDFDSDGDLDLFLGNTGADRMLRNDGRGAFSEVAGWSPVPFHHSYDACVVDIDRDGDRDIVVASSLGTGVYRNDRTAWVGRTIVGAIVPAALTVAAADLDRDGWAEVFVSRPGYTHLLQNLRDPELTFSAQTEELPCAVDDARAARFADLDADGDADLVAATPTGTFILFNDSGSFVDPPSGALVIPPRAFLAAVGDLDADGDPDLVLIDNGDPFTLVGGLRGLAMTNDGRGRFVGRRTFSGILAANAVLLADVTGDRRLDLIAADDRAEQIFVQQSDGTFQAGGSLPAFPNDSSHCLAAGDVDGDGDIDLVFGGDNHCKLYVNGGGGAFTPGLGLPGRPDSTLGVTLVDLDADGDLDLAVANFRSPNRVLRNDGRGRFTDLPASQFPAPVADNRALAAGDIDGDGDVDLLFAAWGQNRLYRADPTGFVDVTASALPPNTEAGNAVALGDVDGDGDLDAAFGTLGTPNLLLNDGHGVFQRAAGALPVLDEATRSVWLFDSDGDGDTDLLTVPLLRPPHLLTNLARQVEPRNYALAGCPYESDIFIEPWRGGGRGVLPMLGAGHPGPTTTVAGRLWLDPARIIALPALMTSSAGAATLSLTVPGLSALRGLNFTLQAVALHDTAPSTWRLTNAVAEHVGR